MINREATIRWKGYDPDDLALNSNKRIWAVCDGCGKGRWVYRGQYRDLCQTCSNKLNKRMIKEIKIDQFIRENTNKHFCKCGCSEYVTIKRHHYNSIIPEYIHGHNPIKFDPTVDRSGKNSGSWKVEIDQFIRENTNKHFCKCGCGKSVTIKRSDYYEGIHNFIDGHQSRGKNSGNWKGGISYGKYCEKFNNEFKEIIRNLFGRMCFVCGISEKENGRKLDVHHVNFDKSCLCSSSCEFVPLCRSCHMKTNNKRRYWEDLIMCYLYPDRIMMVDI